MIIYFDNAATTKVKDEVLKEMEPYFCEQYGNPSSLYTIGRRAKKAIEEAREKVANLIGAEKNEIYFTASGSESDNTALKGVAFANKHKGNHIITSKIEHPAILETCLELEKQGFEVTYLKVNDQGLINLQELKDSIRPETILISIMFANNEIGTLQPIEEIAKIAREKNIIFHTDAVQAVGNVNINVKELGIDMLSLSGHKIYGPKGIGALYVKKGIEFDKFIHGGHQEKNKRAGTENTAGIVGLGKASEIAKEQLNEYSEKLQTLRDYYIKEVTQKISDIRINGSMDSRLPGNINISFKDIDSSALLLELDKRGICVSSGSACSSGNADISHVITAIKVPPEYAKGALRVTFGDFNTKAQVDYMIDNLIEAVKELRKM